MVKVKNSDWYMLAAISLPIFLQSILFSSRNLVDVFLLGGLGDNEVAAMGAACRYLILSTVIMFAVAKSISQKMSRRYGEGDYEQLKIQFINLLATILPISVLISCVFFFFSSDLIGISTSNISVISLGSDYLKIVAFQLPFTSVVIALSLALRVVHKPQVSTNFSALNIAINIVLTYVLVSDIFYPSLGIIGAAISTIFSSLVEFVFILLFLRSRKESYVFYFDFSELKQHFSFREALSLAKFSFPMIASGFLYSFAMFVYVSVFGRIGEIEQAAISIIFSLESLLMGLAIGLSQGAGVLIGGAIGKKDYKKMSQLINTTFLLGLVSSVISAFCIWNFQDYILMFFTGMSFEAVLLTKSMLGFMVFTLFLRSFSVILYNGVLRAGGDNKFCMKVDLISIWFFVVPMIMLLSGVLSPLALFVLLYLEDVLKILIGMYRIRNDRWVKQI